MKLDDKQINNLVVVGDTNTKEAKINPDKLAKLQYLLTNGLYSDGIGSTVVEITNNALDSIIQAGKDPMANPVYVYIENNPKTGRYQLRIVDNGLGLDEYEFENVVMSYLTSTKEDSDDVIGAFGIGAKSWCSVSNTATFICRKNGKEYNFLCYKGPAFLKYDKIWEKDTEEENGVTFILPIKDWSEKHKFVEKAKQKLAYYDNVVLMIDGHVVNNNIYRAEDFQWATLNYNHQLHFSLKDVYYSINFELLGIDPVNTPICLRFGLKDGIMPNPSREAIIWTDNTINLFKDKIKKVAEWFANKYNETVKDYTTLLEAWDNIDVDTHYVYIKDKGIVIDSLLRAAGIDVKEPVVKGLALNNAKFYKGKFSEFLYEYQPVAYINHSDNWVRSERKWPNLRTRLLHKERVVLLESAPVGHFKAYLLEEYPRDTLFVVKRRDRKLGTKHSQYGYRNLLELDSKPKAEWRGLIKEWQFVQQTVVVNFENAVKLESSKDYQDWLTQRKADIKANRARGTYGANYRSLNKQKGDITVSFARKFKHGGKAVFDRMTVPIATLHKLGHLTVYFTKEQAQADNDFIYKALMALPNVKFAWLNPSEMKHVRNLKTWKTKEEFMFSKPLKRYITANLISDYLDLIPETNQNIIYEAFPKFRAMKNTLHQYVNEHNVDADDDLFNELKAVAVENNQLDMEIYPLLEQFKKAIEDFGFLKYIKEPSRWNSSEAERRILKNIVYIMLKNKRVSCRMVEDFQLVEVHKDPIPDEDIAYWQPKLDVDGYVAGHQYKVIEENEVWLKKDNLLKDYPRCIPIALRADDIHDPEIHDPEPEEDELDEEILDETEVVDDLEDEELEDEELEEEEENTDEVVIDEDDELHNTDALLERVDRNLEESTDEEVDKEDEEFEHNRRTIEVEDEEEHGVAIINIDEPEEEEVEKSHEEQVEDDMLAAASAVEYPTIEVPIDTMEGEFVKREGEPEVLLDVVNTDEVEADLSKELIDQENPLLEVVLETEHHSLSETAKEEFLPEPSAHPRIESGIPLPKGTRKPKGEVEVVAHRGPINYDTNLDDQYYAEYL